MKGMTKKLFGLLLVFVPVLFMLPSVVFAQDDAAEAHAWPFLSVAIDGEELTAKNIVFKGLIDLGSLESSWAYVHEDVPYYHVTVPCGTESVDVTYSAETNILDSGSNAYGYATELTVDAVSSATIKRRSFSNSYTLNEDGTQTVKTPVTDYVVKEDDTFMAITLEEDGGNCEAICLFSFLYDREHHAYTAEVTPPTETAGGHTTYSCVCGAGYTVTEALVDNAFGDVNADQAVNGIDSVLILKYAANTLQSDFNLAAADVNGDGSINGVDAVLILKYAAGTISKFPAE